MVCCFLLDHQVSNFTFHDAVQWTSVSWCFIYSKCIDQLLIRCDFGGVSGYPLNNRKNSACDLSSSTLNSLTPVQHSIGTRAMMRTGFGAAGCDPKKTSSHSWHTSFTSLKVDIFRLKHLCRLVAKKKNVWCYIASWKWYLSLDVTGISLIAFDPLDLWDGQVRLVRLRQLADGREWREIMLISLLLQVSSPSI